MKDLDFGDYCLIEQKRYGGYKNEMFLYKVISGNLKSNRWVGVPVDARETEMQRGDIEPVIRVVQCGISENKVEVFRLCDIKPYEGQSLGDFKP